MTKQAQRSAQGVWEQLSRRRRLVWRERAGVCSSNNREEPIAGMDALLEPALMEEILLQHVPSEVLDSEVLSTVHDLNVLVSFLPIKAVFLASVFEKAHTEALVRRRQLRRQELQESQRFVGQLAVTVFGVDGLKLPPPPPGFHQIATVCQLTVDKNVMTTTRCSAPTLFWDQEFDFEVVSPCLQLVCTVASVIQPLPQLSAQTSTPRSQTHAREPDAGGGDAAVRKSAAGRDLSTTSARADGGKVLPGGSAPALAPPNGKTVSVVPRPILKQGEAPSHSSAASALRRGFSASSFSSQTSQDRNVTTVPLAVVSVPLSSLENCKARKASLPLQPAVASANASADNDSSAPDDGRAAATVQVRLQYSYNESYMAHDVPLGGAFCIGIIGAGGNVGRKMLQAFVASGLVPCSRIIACTRTVSKAKAVAAPGVICTDKYDAAIARCQVVVLCCRADHLANQVTTT